MEERNLDKALDIVSTLINGEEIHKSIGEHTRLYEEYSSNAEVYDILNRVLNKLNLSLYEYNYGLYLCAGEQNKVFGYTNAELRKELGLKTNKELYLCFFIIYQLITQFYYDSAGYAYVEYVKIEEVIHKTGEAFAHLLKELDVLVQDEIEENSFKTIALLWEDMPTVTSQEAMRAAKNSKSGYVKTVLNFLVAQKLLVENEERYYPTERMKAMVENYFGEFKGRLYEIMRGKGEESDAAY